MPIINTWRWTGALSTEWSDDNGTLSNWVLLSGTASQPGFPGFFGSDIAVIDTDASITANNSPGHAQEVQIVNGATVTYLSGNFAAGDDSGAAPEDGLIVDEDATLILAPGVNMSDNGADDVVGLTGDGTLEVQTGAGFATLKMIVGAGDGASGEITVDGAFAFEVVQSAPGATDGVLIVGEDGDGSLSLTDTLFFATTTTVAQNDGSSGDLTLDNTTWAGSSLTIGPAGNGTVTMENGSTAAITTILVGPNGELDVTGAGGITSSVLAPKLTLAFGTIAVSGGGEVDVGSATGVAGAVDVAGTTLIGLGTINGNVVVDPGGVVEADQPLDGTLTVNGNISGTGKIEPIRTFEVNGGIAAATTIQFSAPPPGTSQGVLQLDVPRGDLGTITGFSLGNTIDVEGLLFSDAVFAAGTGGNPGTLTLSNGTDPSLELKVDGDYSADSFVATPGTTDTLVTLVPCYCAGTLIATARGDKPVEDLKVGDAVMTMAGLARPIRWIGRRSYAGRFIRGNKDILPVCIKAGALADNVPRRDPWISPHHAMYFKDRRPEGVLTEAKDLVNGVSIVQAERVEKVEYFHVELDTHDVIIAEGALSESYIDDDDRLLFHNARDYYARYGINDAVSAQYCAPRLEEGYEVERVRQRIASRAGLLRMADGQRIAALRGFVDEVAAHRVAGWAQTVDHPEAPVCLDIYADGELIGQVLANRYRDDLEQAGIGSGRHGFAFTSPTALSSGTVEVRRSLDGAAVAFTPTQ
jgi:Hint domain